jgi:hypothetical protein
MTGSKHATGQDKRTKDRGHGGTPGIAGSLHFGSPGCDSCRRGGTEPEYPACISELFSYRKPGFGTQYAPDQEKVKIFNKM